MNMSYGQTTNGAIAQDTKRSYAVSAAYNRLSEATGRLSSAAASLHGRIAPVMRPNPPDAKSGENASDPVSGVQMADAIDEQARFVLLQARLLEDMYDRVEL